MATVEQTTMKVQRLLTGPMGLKVSLDGESIQIQFSGSSTAVNLLVREWGKTKEGDPETLVQIWATVLRDVAPSPELFEWAAREGGGYFFGHVRVVDGEPGSGKLRLVMAHTLLGDFLDQRELEAAMYGVLTSADELDDKLKERFGGKRWSDE